MRRIRFNCVFDFSQLCANIDFKVTAMTLGRNCLFNDHSRPFIFMTHLDYMIVLNKNWPLSTKCRGASGISASVSFICTVDSSPV